jgi:hypothetical protein
MEMCQGFEIGGGFSHFEERGAFAGAGHDEVRLDGGLGPQFFQQAPAVDGTAGSGDSYNDAQVTRHPWFFIEILSNRTLGKNLFRIQNKLLAEVLHRTL